MISFPNNNNHSYGIALYITLQARSTKLAENIQAAVGIRVQQLCEKQDKLLAELEIWRQAESSRLSDIQQLMSDVLAAGSKDDADVIFLNSHFPPYITWIVIFSQVEEVFNRAGKILEEARLCSTSASAGRITFDEEELALTRQEQMAPLEETPPSAGPADGTCARTLHATKSIGAPLARHLKISFSRFFFFALFFT